MSRLVGVTVLLVTFIAGSGCVVTLPKAQTVAARGGDSNDSQAANIQAPSESTESAESISEVAPSNGYPNYYNRPPEPLGDKLMRKLVYEPWIYSVMFFSFVTTGSMELL